MSRCSGSAADAAEAIEHRPFDQAHAQVREEWRNVPRRRPVALLSIQLAPKSKKEIGD
jgi:hypothetical protein